MELKSVVSMVKTVGPGVDVSYGRTYTTRRETKIATVPIGYADGYPRAPFQPGRNAGARPKGQDHRAGVYGSADAGRHSFLTWRRGRGDGVRLGRRRLSSGGGGFLLWIKPSIMKRFAKSLRGFPESTGAGSLAELKKAGRLAR